MPFKPHLSIARRLEPLVSERIQAYLKTLPIPYFKLVLNNLTLFVYEKTYWKIKSIFLFSS